MRTPRTASKRRDFRGAQSIVPRVEIDGLRSLVDRERDDIKGRLDRLEGWYFDGRPE